MAKEKLRKAYEKKNDEFYTLYEDIAAEVPLYKAQLQGKRILCPAIGTKAYPRRSCITTGNMSPHPICCHREAM